MLINSLYAAVYKSLQTTDFICEKHGSLFLSLSGVSPGGEPPCGLTALGWLGIDSAETFHKVTSEAITFEAASTRWLTGIADGSIVSKKSREAMKPATISSYQSSVTFLNDKAGVAELVLADFHNGEAKKLITRIKAMTPKFSNKTIVTYFQTVQNVIASVEKDNGDKMYPRDWNLIFIGLPKIDTRKQNKPALDDSEIETILSKAKAPYRTLYALLAGSGLRVGEAVGLRVEHVLDNCSRLVVAQSVWGGKEQTFVRNWPSSCTSISATQRGIRIPDANRQTYQPTQYWAR